MFLDLEIFYQPGDSPDFGNDVCYDVRRFQYIEGWLHGLSMLKGLWLELFRAEIFKRMFEKQVIGVVLRRKKFHCVLTLGYGRYFSVLEIHNITTKNCVLYSFV